MADIPGTFWFGRFDVLGKMVQIEEMTERSRRVEYDSMRNEETVSVQPRREGERIAIATARLGNDEMGHFPTQKSAKIKRVGYIILEIYLRKIIVANPRGSLGYNSFFNLFFNLNYLFLLNFAILVIKNTKQ